MDLLTISLLRLVSGAYKYEHLTSLIVTLVINDTIFHETWLIEHKTTEGADLSWCWTEGWLGVCGDLLHNIFLREFQD